MFKGSLPTAVPQYHSHKTRMECMARSGLSDWEKKTVDNGVISTIDKSKMIINESPPTNKGKRKMDVKFKENGSKNMDPLTNSLMF